MQAESAWTRNVTRCPMTERSRFRTSRSTIPPSTSAKPRTSSDSLSSRRPLSPSGQKQRSLRVRSTPSIIKVNKLFIFCPFSSFQHVAIMSLNNYRMCNNYLWDYPETTVYSDRLSIIYPPISDAFDNRDYFFLHYTNDSTFTLRNRLFNINKQHIFSLLQKAPKIAGWRKEESFSDYTVLYGLSNDMTTWVALVMAQWPHCCHGYARVRKLGRKTWGGSGGAELGDLSLSLLLDGWIRSSVTSKKSPNVYKSCSIMIPLEKEIFWHIHKNGLKCGQFGHNNCCHRL